MSCYVMPHIVPLIDRVSYNRGTFFLTMQLLLLISKLFWNSKTLSFAEYGLSIVNISGEPFIRVHHSALPLLPYIAIATAGCARYRSQFMNDRVRKARSVFTVHLRCPTASDSIFSTEPHPGAYSNFRTKGN